MRTFKKRNKIFYNSCIISCALIGQFLWSVRGETEFFFYARKGHLPSECQTLILFFSLVSQKIHFLSVKSVSKRSNLAQLMGVVRY